MIKTTLLASLLCTVQAFAPPVRQLVRSVPLHSSSISFNDNSAAALMNQAIDCSLSDTCSVEQAEWYLQEIINIQSGCVIGTVVDDAVCEDQQVVAQAVAGLRQKILTKRPVAKSVDAVTPVMLAGVLMLVTAKILTTNFGGDATVAFTPEEWWWAFRDNYFAPTMIHFIREGGLLIDL